MDPNRLVASSHLFWTAVTLLGVPYDTFPAIHRQALANCHSFLSKVDFAACGVTFDSPFFAGVKGAQQAGDFAGIQVLLLQGIFWHQDELEAEALELLLLAWRRLPAAVVDPTPSGFMYTLLYVLPYLHSNLQKPLTLSKMTSALAGALSQQKPREFEKSLQVLHSLAAGTPGVAPAEVFDTLCRELHRQYFHTYGRNVVEYFAFVLKTRPKHCVGVVGMARWLSAIETSTSVSLTFKPFLKFLPSVTHLECRPDIMELLHLVFRLRTPDKAAITTLNIDVTGAPEKLEFPEILSHRGSVSSLYHIFSSLCPAVVQ